MIGCGERLPHDDSGDDGLTGAGDVVVVAAVCASCNEICCDIDYTDVSAHSQRLSGIV
jgi:hypothetical protein